MTLSTPTHTHPVLLFPLRIETRFVGSELLVRIYPDDVMIHAHDKRLNQTEADLLREYQAIEGDKMAAWRGLVQKLGTQRAAYLANIAHLDDGQPQNETFSAAPRVRLLPDRFKAYLYQDKTVTDIEWAVKLEKRELPLLENTEEGTDVLIADQAAWIVDFAAAEQVGMAVRIPAPKDHYCRLIVIGLNSDDAQKGADDLAELINAHRFSSGFAVAPYGMATNNTGDVRSGYADVDEDAEQSYAIECKDYPISDSTLGGALADALGVEKTIFARIAHAADPKDTLEETMRASLWPALGDYLLTHLVSNPLSIDARSWLSEHFRKFVSARGFLPSIRIGKQPYGIVPVTAINKWEPPTPDLAGSAAKAGYEETLHNILLELFTKWLGMAQNAELVPRLGGSADADQELFEVLAMQPTSVSVHLRRLVDDRFIGWIFSQCDPQLILPKTPGLKTMEECVQYWLQILTEQRQPAMTLLSKIASQTLSEAKILDIYAWGEDSASLEDLEIKLVVDDQNEADPLGYIDKFKTELPAADRHKPLFYDLLRRAILYTMSTRPSISSGPITSEDSEGVRPSQPIGPSILSGSDSPALTEGIRPSIPLGSVSGESQSSESESLFDKALSKLAAETNPVLLEDALHATLDLHSHRLDAWLTSLATRRLQTMRGAGSDGAKGIYTGVYGWVEDLHRGEGSIGDAKSGGYIHAPSCAQAAAGAVLRNAFLSHANDPEGNACRINLSSERVRRANRLLQGMREGQELAALLGYQFEHGLHDTNNDRYIDDFRADYPLVKASESKSAESQEAVAARNVVDGLKLAKDWMEHPEAVKSHVSINKGVEIQLERLSDTLDAVLDLLLYEAIYQQVQGNYERSAAALDAMDGEGLPSEPESIQTPPAGTAFRQRVCVLLPNILSKNISSPRSMAEPKLAHWFGLLLGELENIGCLAWVSCYRNVRSEVYQPLDLNQASKDELINIALLDEVLAQQIIDKRQASGRFLNLQEVKELFAEDDARFNAFAGVFNVLSPQRVVLSDLDIDALDFLYLCKSLPEALISSQGFRQPTDEDLRAGDTELEARIKYHIRKLNGLGPHCEIAIDFAPQLSEFTRSIADAIEVSRGVFGLLAGASYLKPAFLHRPEDVNETPQFAREDFEELDDRVEQARQDLELLTPDQFLKFGRYGIEGAIPPSLVMDPDEISRKSAVKKASDQRLEQCSSYRQEACKFSSGSDGRAVDINKAVEMMVEAMKALFGAEFVVLPTFSAPQYEEFFNEQAILIKDEQRIHLWLQQVAQTHSAVRRLEDAMLVAEAWKPLKISESGDSAIQANQLEAMAFRQLRVAQLSDGDTPYWLALSDAEIADQVSGDKFEDFAKNGWPGSVLSLVCWAPLSLESKVKVPSESKAKLSGLFIDEWNELIPSATRATGIGFQYDRPNSQAPQALLLAVPGSAPGDREAAWTLDELKDIVNDTLDLAKVRAVDIDALDATVGGLFPASILPSDASRPGWARNTPEPELAEAIEKTLSRILTGTVNVLVTEEGGKPFRNVRVTIDGANQEGNTNEEGRISFSNLPIGNLTLTAWHPRYHECSQGITLLFDETKNAQLQLALLPGIVEVTVSKEVRMSNKQMPLATPASGAKVTLGELTGKTDAKGFYCFATVKPGKYKVAAILPPFVAAPEVMVVKGGGDVVTVNILLVYNMTPPSPRPKPGPNVYPK